MKVFLLGKSDGGLNTYSNFSKVVVKVFSLSEGQVNVLVLSMTVVVIISFRVI